MKPEWKRTIELGDIFHDDSIEWREKRDEMVRRVRRSTAFCQPDWELDDLIAELADSVTADEWDDAWDAFYDWADANRIWINTRSQGPGVISEQLYANQRTERM